MDDRFVVPGSTLTSPGDLAQAQNGILARVGKLETYRRGQPGFETHPLCDDMDLCIETRDPRVVFDFYRIIYAHNDSRRYAEDQVGFWVGLSAVKAFKELSAEEANPLVRSRGFSPHVYDMSRVSGLFAHGMVIDRARVNEGFVYKIYWFSGAGFLLKDDAGRIVIHRTPSDETRDRDIAISAANLTTILAHSV